MKFYAQKVLAVSFLSAMLLVAVEVAPWISLFSGLILFWKWGVEEKGWRPLSRGFTGLLSVLLLIQVLLQYRTLIGQEPAYTFLLGLAALRVMDFSEERDRKSIVLLGFLLVSIKALFSLDIYWALPSALSFAGLWYALLPTNLPRRAQTLGRIFLLSAPLTILFFFAFPRFVMPWAISRGHGVSQIGFSDAIDPGQVARIAADTSLAFRAKLFGMEKQTSDLYWKGVTLTHSRGLSWQKGPWKRAAEQPPDSESSSYDVAIEPTGQGYLFVLDGTQHVEMESYPVMRMEGGQFRSTRPLHKSTVYRGYISSSEEDTHEDNNSDVKSFLKTPVLEERVQVWVDDVKKNNSSVQDRLQKLRQFFSQSGFVYSMRPGTYGKNDLAKFLFERRVGFCEHFAGAYATLARALEIPSRVVVGYQGGGYNPRGDFWKVEQRNAHAWVEIFSEGHWQRVDPTMWVAPLRFIIGAEAFFSLSEEDQRALARNLNWRPAVGEGGELSKDFSFWLEDLNYRWSYFLLDFDKAAQKDFWRNLAQSKFLFGGLAVLLLGVVLGGLYIVWRPWRKLPVEKRLLWEIENWGQSQDVPRAVDEPPLSYFQRLALEFPALDETLRTVSLFYDEQVYRESAPSSQKPQRLVQQWRRVSKGLEAGEG